MLRPGASVALLSVFLLAGQPVLADGDDVADGAPDPAPQPAASPDLAGPCPGVDGADSFAGGGSLASLEGAASLEGEASLGSGASLPSGTSLEGGATLDDQVPRGAVVGELVLEGGRGPAGLEGDVLDALHGREIGNLHPPRAEARFHGPIVPACARRSWPVASADA